MSPFQSKKAIWSSVGAAFVFAAVLCYAIFMPGLATPLGSDAPDLRVPNMQHPPGHDAPLELEVVAQPPDGDSANPE